MKLIVDCGATKAEWLLSSGKNLRTAGFNLQQTPPEQLEQILGEAASALGPGIESVYFYAAGLVGDVPLDWDKWFPGARVECSSDMLGAARAVCGTKQGLAAIIGTGANTCQYNGSAIVHKVNCGGFILGDEGSAAVLGKLFLADYLRGLVPPDVATAFEAHFPADYPTLVRNVYATPGPARYLGGFAPFLMQHYAASEYVRGLVDGNFRRFFERVLSLYPSLPLGVVGGFGHACEAILRRLGAEYGVRFSRFLRSPMEGLAVYHF